MAATLPPEIIEDIGKRLDTKSDICRFRAVCRSWRSSIPPVDLNLQTFNIKLCVGGYCCTTSVTETAVYHHLLSPAINPDKVERDRDRLVKLYRPSFHPLPINGPVMNVLDFGGFELAKTYSSGTVSKFVTSTNLYSPDVMLISYRRLYHGKLDRDEKGNVHVYQVSFEYEDVIFYQGMFYAVDQDGRAVVIDSSLKLTMVAGALPVCSKNLYQDTYSPYIYQGDCRVLSLVESSGDLLLVDRIMKKGWSCVDNYLLESDVKFKVYKLDAVEKQWVEMQASDLSDRILVVLGHEHCSFSVDAKDFPACQGNCIYFSVEYSFRVGVFDLSSGTLLDPGSLPDSGIFHPRRKIFWLNDHDR